MRTQARFSTCMTRSTLGRGDDHAVEIPVHRIEHRALEARAMRADTGKVFDLHDQINALIKADGIALNLQLLWENLLISWENI